MIKKDEVFKIGVFNKPHGVKGELSSTFTDDIFDRVDCDYLICLLDGILVPFFIEEYRFRSDTTALVKLDRIDNAEQARKFTNVEVYFPLKYVEEDDSDDIPTWGYFVGFVAETIFGASGVVDARCCEFSDAIYTLCDVGVEEIFLYGIGWCDDGFCGGVVC